MDSSGFDDHTHMMMKIENSNNSIPRFSSLREIKKLFRVTEIFLILIFLTWSSTHLPVAVKVSGEYFRQLANIVVSHLFVFLLSNVIVLTLIFNSRHFFPHQSFQNLGEIDVEELCGEFIEFSCEAPSQRSEEIVYEEKRTVIEVTSEVKVHRRSQSESLRREKMMSLEEDSGKQLRRSETEKRRKVVDDGGETVVDELSNEEFQRAIEAFITKQIKFHKQEKIEF
ncbi:hypothetical protein BUALT_Bualt04G0004400 [Buddleja alternifolia]|uniref:Uncharacterized protein n=1 Tax=Buddleja alternifolia TaxID=168488 RepID=A0AAV6XPE9_9LAMI|nr:hypothetical protein BUALT_Bualt04G0004400 [Buddleja alternifolia]